MSSKVSFAVQPVQRVIATKTLAAIDQALESDQGSKFRSLLRITMEGAEDAYRVDNDSFRSHLGASQIGRECARELWYTFRWALARDFGNRYGISSDDERTATAARYIRLLNRGHLEEARFIALMMMIGVKVWSKDENGKQFLVSRIGGHYGGSCDSVLLGLPDCPDIPLLGEFKTHNDASFTKLLNEGLRESKYEHFSQMQTYMGGLELRGGLYLAVNKDNDALYGELVGYSPEMFDYQETRAKKIILTTIPPQKISPTPGFFKCKMCDFRGICHKIPSSETNAMPVPAINCRTCEYSVALESGGWRCNKFHKMLTKKEQLEGCPSYKMIDM